MIELKLSDRTITTNHKAFVMGIVNVTPDSFWKKSRGGKSLALKLIREGADILDIGAESTRPGSSYVSEEVQIKRLVPIIKAIRKVSDIPVSVDTRSARVFKECRQAGADILNDVAALEDDAELAPYCAKEKVPVILMHKRSTPDKMQQNTTYTDIFKEVDEYLQNRIQYALKQGISSDKIILDPGIGFGKDGQGNCELIKDCGKLCSSKYPVLMALSRKSVIGFLTNNKTKDRLCGTIVADIIAVLHGASLIRVHDVKEAVDSLRVLDGIEYGVFTE
ncbi:MAG: dihydropteroate synthase [Treponema sp.]|nr:dihydropteroate synthase [Treponema sp.]